MSQRLAAQFAQLEEDRQQLRTILSGMVEGVVALDAEQRILFANDGPRPAAGVLSSRGGVGRKLWEVVAQRLLQDVVRRPCETGACRGGAELERPLGQSLTVHARRLPGSAAPRRRPGAARHHATCAAWNGCGRTSSPTSRTS